MTLRTAISNCFDLECYLLLMKLTICQVIIYRTKNSSLEKDHIPTLSLLPDFRKSKIEYRIFGSELVLLILVRHTSYGT